MKEENNNSSRFIVPILPLLSVLVVVIFAVLKRQDTVDIIKSSLIVLLLSSTIVFYINMQKNRYLMNKKSSKIFFTLSYIASICLAMQPYSPNVYIFWLLGSLLIAMLIDDKLALMTCLNITILLSINSGLRPEQTIHLLIVGLLMITLSNYLKEKSSFVYASIIIISTNITLAFVINNFIFDYTYDYIKSLLVLIFILILAHLIYKIYKSKQVDEYELLLSEDNELWTEIKNHSKSLYEHSKLIGDLSEKAAEKIGADPKLSKAGGRFHEVGKIRQGNYMEENLKIAEDYSFPQELRDVINEHNIMLDKPSSVESAIVMLTDHLVSTLQYISKTKNNIYSKDKIIEQLFQIRLKKGAFDKCGLLVKDYIILKDFFIEEFQD